MYNIIDVSLYEIFLRIVNIPFELILTFVGIQHARWDIKSSLDRQYPVLLFNRLFIKLFTTVRVICHETVC